MTQTRPQSERNIHFFGGGRWRLEHLRSLVCPPGDRRDVSAGRPLFIGDEAERPREAAHTDSPSFSHLSFLFSFFLWGGPVLSGGERVT